MTEPEDVIRFYPRHAQAIGEPTIQEKRISQLEAENAQLSGAVQDLRKRIGEINWECTLLRRELDKTGRGPK